MKSAVHTLFWITLITTIVGMYKPWIVLWWLSVKNRKTVLKYYGTAVAILFLILMFV